MLQWISALPDNVVNNIFTTINTLVCGVIVAFFTSTFLKKKEERTRIITIWMPSPPKIRRLLYEDGVGRVGET